jgi:hypothetical protein
MLIDCGVFKNSPGLAATPGEAATMQRVMESISEATGGHLHILVATHEHWDHICGFLHAEESFRALRIDEVWLAWTEDPQDEIANQLRARRANALRGVHAAISRLRAMPSAGSNDLAERLEAITHYFGDGRALSMDLAGTGMAGAEVLALGISTQTAAAMNVVKEKVERPRYCHPREVLEIPDVTSARIYVLGPPRDVSLLKRSNPSSKGHEVYERVLALDLPTSFWAAAEYSQANMDTLGFVEREQLEMSLPFEKRQRIDPAVAGTLPFFQQHYYGRPHTGNSDVTPLSGSSVGDLTWRQIEHDWLQVAEQIALQLDSDTNNTSLALAIELVPSGHVLLFPADAQVGNWLSWENLAWKTGEVPGVDKAISGHDLLRRTVFYKVGHHASHNATLREKGLELMNSTHLTAMIPVDEAMAHKPKGLLKNGWDMPFGPLLDRLDEKTRGRVIRADTGGPSTKPKLMTDNEWNAFRKRLRETSLFIEYTVDV